MIPARSGSKRIPGKNTRMLAGKPLMAYSIASALESKVFDKVLVSSDDGVTLGLAVAYGADVICRPEEFATDTSPDIDWVEHALLKLQKQGDEYNTYAILRPTSPFRTAKLIRDAADEWEWAREQKYTSLRAVEPVEQHAGKQWVRQNTGQITPVLLQPDMPYHSSQKAALPKLYMQNACIEFSSPSVALTKHSIAGDTVWGFFMEGVEGHDLNTEEDWAKAEAMLEAGAATLPAVN